MSTALNDLSAGVVCFPGLVPNSYPEAAVGEPIDLIAGDGAGFAVLSVGAIEAGTTVGGYLEQSDDRETWFGDPLATFPSVATANAVRVVSFRRTGRYVRATVTVDGADPLADVAVIVGQQRK